MNKSNHQKMLDYLKDNKRWWYSPRNIEEMVGLYTTDGQVSRRCREDRALGFLKSSKVQANNGRWYVVYKWRGNAKKNNSTKR